MKFDCQALCLVLVVSTGFYTLVSGKTNNVVIAKAATTSVSPMPMPMPMPMQMPMPTPKPTAAPLHTSTPRPPTNVGKPTPAPTKAPTMIINTPPKLTGQKKVEHLHAEGKPKMAMSEATPLQTPPMDTKTEVPKSELSSVRPLQVTGFITKNGNIYEVQDKEGVGLIEGRQNPESEKESHVCNYGSVVIYSDVPCDQVTNVRIGEVQHTVINAAEPDPIDVQPQPQPQPQQQQQQEQQHGQGNEVSDDNNSADNHDDNEIPDFDESTGPISPPKRRGGNQNKRRRGNGNRSDVNRKRPNRVRQGGNRNGQGPNRRPFRQQPQQQQQQRRRQQFNRNQSQQQRRRQQQQRRRNQYGNNNRNTQRRQNQRGQSNRRPYDDYADEERKA